MFGCVDGGYIYNLKTEDGFIECWDGTYAGSIVGLLLEGNIKQCTNTCSVRNGKFTGGIVGSVQSKCNVVECKNIGRQGYIVGGNYSGGIAGVSYGNISSCTNTMYHMTDGGIVGSVNGGSVYGCTNSGVMVKNTQSDSNFGTLFGRLFSDSATVSSCVFSGTIYYYNLHKESSSGPQIGTTI